MDPSSIIPLPAKIPMIARFVTDLPDPDSPTIASVSPLYKSNDISLTARTNPFGVRNEIFKLLTSSTFSFFIIRYLLTVD